MRSLLFLSLVVCLLTSCSKEPEDGDKRYTVTYIDAAGVEQERTAPAPESRERIVVFPLEARWGFQEGLWLGHSFPLLLWVDLQQDLHLDLVDPSMVEAKVQELEFGTREPMSVIEGQRVAEALNAGHFAAGVFSSDGKGIDLRLILYDTATREGRGSLGTNWDSFFAGVDSTSRWLRSMISPEPRETDAWDRPVVQLTTGSVEAMQYFSEGWWRYSRENQAAEAIDYLDRAVEADSSFALAGLTLYWAGRGILTEPARGEALGRSFRHSDRLPESLRLAVEAAYHQRLDRDRARGAVTLLTGLYPMEPFAQETAARVLVTLGEQDQAMAHFRRTLDMQPWRERLFESVISLYREAGREEEALELCRGRVERFPRNADARFILGQLLTLAGDYEAARAELRRATGIDPDHPRALEGLGLVSLRRGDLEGAEKDFRSGLKRADPATKARIYTQLAGGYFDRGRLARALEILEEGQAELEPVRPVLAWRLDVEAGRYLADLGNYSFALETFRNSPLRRDVDLAWMPELAEARVLVKMGRLNEAQVRVVGTTAAIQHPGMDQAALEMTVLGEIALARGDRDDALERFSFVKALKPDDRDNLLRIAQIHLQNENRGEAESALADARLHFPHDPRVHAQLARLRESQGRIPEAIDHLEEAVRLWRGADTGIPYVEEARRRLERLKKSGRS